MFPFPAEGAAVNFLVQRFHRYPEGVLSICILHKWNKIRLRSLLRLSPGSHIQFQITGPAHSHNRAHSAILHRKFTLCNPEHAGAGVHPDLIDPILQRIRRNRLHSVFHRIPEAA